jgi:RNA polymerase sigma-70 factor (ECF subfamily)
MSDPTLQSLAARAAKGDDVALNELLERLRPSLVRAARLIAGAGTSVGEDAAQEALLDVARGLHGLKEPDAVHAWALRVAVRRAIKIARRERLRSTEMLNEAWIAEPAEDQGRISAVREAFYSLPPRLRAVAVLRLYLGLTENETARVLDRRVGTVKSQLYEARSRLARSLERGGYRPNTVSQTEGEPT